MPRNKTHKDLEKMLDMPLYEIKRFIKDFHSEMRKGLSGRKSSLKMIPTYATRPKGTEKGNFLALDLGGTNFRVLSLKLNGKRKISALLTERFVLQEKHITGTGKTLFDFIADCVKKFLIKHKMCIGEKHKIGFTFSFPVKKRNIASGVLLRWTKGFRAKGVEGKDVVKLLNESLARKELRNAKVTSLANDTVSTLVAKSYEDPNCDMGVILGTGTNACYSEKLSGREEIINIEWGNFNKLRLTPYDRKLDRASKNPGEQRLEKMVSGMYLDKVARFVVNDLIAGINLPKSFKAEYMSVIESDTSKSLPNINMLLKKLGISNSKYADRKLLKRICTIVSTRAARISAAAIASVVTKMDPHLTRKHTVAIDGSVYEKHSGFSRRIKLTLKEIFGRKAKNIKLSLTKDASGKGAAIIAALNNS